MQQKQGHSLGVSNSKRSINRQQCKVADALTDTGLLPTSRLLGSNSVVREKRWLRQLRFREPAVRAQDARTGWSTTATPGEALGPDDAKPPAVRAGPQ